MTALIFSLTLLPSAQPLTSQQQVEMLTGYVDPRVTARHRQDSFENTVILLVVLVVLAVTVWYVRRVVRWSRLTTRYTWGPTYQRYVGTNTFELEGMELGTTLKALALVTLKPDGHPSSMLVNGKLNLTVVESVHVTTVRRFNQPRLWWW